MNQLSRRITNSLFSLECFVCLGRQENSIRWMTNETEIDTIVIDKVMKFGDLLFCDCCYIRICLLYSLIPPEELFSPATVGILHVCGGDPCVIASLCFCERYSPHMWR